MNKKNQVNKQSTIQPQRNWILVGTMPMVLATLLYIASDFVFSTAMESGAHYAVRATLFVISIIAVSLSIAGIFKVHGWTKIMPALCVLLGFVLLLWIGTVLVISSTSSFTF